MRISRLGQGFGRFKPLAAVVTVALLGAAVVVFGGACKVDKVGSARAASGTDIASDDRYGTDHVLKNADEPEPRLLFTFSNRTANRVPGSLGTFGIGGNDTGNSDINTLDLDERQTVYIVPKGRNDDPKIGKREELEMYKRLETHWRKKYQHGRNDVPDQLLEFGFELADPDAVEQTMQALGRPVEAAPGEYWVARFVVRSPEGKEEGIEMLYRSEEPDAPLAALTLRQREKLMTAEA